MPYQSLPLSSVSSTSNRSALHLAVCSGSIEDTSHILQNADIDKNEVRNLLSTKDDLGFTPLHSAVSIPTVALSKNLTKLLLSAGADINSMDALDNTPLHWAARAGNSDVAQMLIMKGCPVGKANRFNSLIFFQKMNSSLIIGHCWICRCSKSHRGVSTTLGYESWKYWCANCTDAFRKWSSCIVM